MMLIGCKYLGTKQAAELLGVTPARVRAMVKQGVLKAERIGREWLIDEREVDFRLQRKPRPGRRRLNDSLPKGGSTGYVHRIKSEAMHNLFRQYKASCAYLPGTYQADVLLGLQNEEERRFCIALADHYLQERQRELIRMGSF